MSQTHALAESHQLPTTFDGNPHREFTSRPHAPQVPNGVAPGDAFRLQVPVKSPIPVKVHRLTISVAPRWRRKGSRKTLSAVLSKAILDDSGESGYRYQEWNQGDWFFFGGGGHRCRFRVLKEGNQVVLCALSKLDTPPRHPNNRLRDSIRCG